MITREEKIQLGIAGRYIELPTHIRSLCKEFKVKLR